MAGIVTEIHVDDLHFQRAIHEAARRGEGKQKEAWELVAEHMRRSTSKTFEAEGRPKKWKPLSPVTLFGRAGGTVKKVFKKRGGMKKRAVERITGAKILRDSNDLFLSIRWRAGRDHVVGSTNTPYAAIHQFGGMAGRGRKVKIPARPFLVVLDSDLKTAAKTIGDYIAGAFGR